MGFLSRFRPQRKFTAQQIQQRREAMLDQAHDYVAKNCAEALRLPASFELEPARGGLESIVYFLRADGIEPMVVRLVEQPRRMRKRMAGHSILGNVGAPVPRVLFQDLSRETRASLGYVVIVEQCLSGVPFADYPDAHQAAAMLGEVFARIHNVQYDRRGEYFDPPDTRRWIRRDNIGPWLRRRSGRWLAKYREVAGDEADIVGQWLKRCPDSAWQQSQRLRVGDVTAGNLLFSPQGLGIIDIYGACFSSAVYEVALLQTGGMLRCDPQLGATFLKAYQPVASPGLWDEIQRGLALCQVLLTLKAAPERFSREPGSVNDYLMRLVRNEYDPVSI